MKTPDADGNFPDIVLGSRFMDGSTEFPVSTVKKIAIVWFRTLLKLGTGRDITDPTTGLQGLSWRTFLFYSRYNHFDDSIFLHMFCDSWFISSSHDTKIFSFFNDSAEA